MAYHREALRHLIERALRRNTFTADQDIFVVVRGDDVWLVGWVAHPDLIPEAVATVEAVSPLINVFSRLQVRGEPEHV